MVATEVSKLTGNADGLSESVQNNTGRLKIDVWERLRARGLASTCYPSLCIKPGLTLSGCLHGTVLDMVGR